MRTRGARGVPTLKAFVFLACLIVPAAAFSQTALEPLHLVPLLAEVEKAAHTCNAFGFDLLAETMRGDTNVNIFESPVGLALALGMVENGATGETAQQMGVALHQGGAAMDDVNRANNSLLWQVRKPELTSLIEASKISTLEIANGVWTQTNAPIKTAFLARVQGNYMADVTNVDFTDPATVTNINSWVSDKTHGKIPSMVSAPLTHDLKLLVLDAVYFKGAWITPFDKKATSDMPFNLADGTVISQPRMSQTGRFGYFEDTNLQAVVLPYSGQQVSLLIILPKMSLADFAPQLTLENWERWRHQWKMRSGTVGLPRFKVDNELNLNHALTAMGMPKAFTWQAEFSGISDQALSISWVMQKVHVEVYEEGTVAAAVSGVGIRPTAVARELDGPFTMTVDRPFYAAIWDNQSGAILFHGAVFDPR
jgi:serine protease inhibitor